MTTTETVADVLAEIRTRPYGRLSREQVHSLADRIESALASAEPVAWTIWDAKDVRFTVYNRDLAAAIAEKGLLALPMFGDYEWHDAQGDKWIPINRLPHTWERELGIGWRQRSAGAHAQPAAKVEALVRDADAEGVR